MISWFESIQLTTIILIVVAGFAAGWVDAVVGGGGLIQLPALLLVPGITPVQALATNKMGSIFGTTTSAVTYYGRVKPDLRTAIPMAVIDTGDKVGHVLLLLAIDRVRNRETQIVVFHIALHLVHVFQGLRHLLFP